VAVAEGDEDTILTRRELLRRSGMGMGPWRSAD
jgi:hypothetical protein